MGSVTLKAAAGTISRAKEASRARSDSEFVSKIDQCAQEADESMLWLELLRDDCAIRSDDLDWLLNESNELIAIFVTMSKNVKRRLAGEK